MEPERWSQIVDVYQSARGLTPRQCKDLLAGLETDIRCEVEALLANSSVPVPEAPDHTQTMITVGTELGPYRIEAPLGKGGMGEVFLGVDTRLGRRVAIKISHLQFSERLTREAHAISLLNHPNICTLYDVGTSPSGAGYLVMELVEGETLAAMLKRGKLAIKVTVQYGAQIADALAAAHSKGITHRDLKPANIMITKAGVKVLDFGLARIVDDETLTAANAVLGTPAYMAPEQREGRPADGRTDIFSLGLVLIEMSTGQRLAHGAAPALDGLPPHFAQILESCLKSDPADRWQAAADLAKALTIAAQTRPAAFPASRAPLAAWRTAAIIAILAASVAAFFSLRPNPPRRQPLILSFTPPPDIKMNPEIAAISPDGRTVAFTARDSSAQSYVWVRALDSPEARRLEATEDASNPFWSPDGRYIAFYTANRLKKVPLAGGPVQTICNSARGLGGAWSSSGDIIFNPTNRAPLMRVSASGGAATPLTSIDASRQENSHRWPSFLPDGRHFFFTARSSLKENTAIYLGSLDSKETKRILTEQSNAAYSPPGFLLFSRDRTLLAQPFNLDKFQVSDEALPVAASIDHETTGARGFFSVSADGSAVVFSGAETPVNQLTWIDRSGNATPVGPKGRYSQPQLSPNGKRIVYTSVDPDSGNRDIWLIDLETSARTRLTSDPANDWQPTWSPDGASIAFVSDRKPYSSLYRKRVDAAGGDELVFNPGDLGGTGGAFRPHWSPDGRLLAFVTDKSEIRGNDLFLLPVSGGGKPVRLFASDSSLSNPRFSPDGKWIAYQSSESGSSEVYLRPLNQLQKFQISVDGGFLPIWRKDGKELFYRRPGATIYVVDIQLGDLPRFSRPRPLFNACASPESTINSFERDVYDVAEDGKRFLFSCPVLGANRRSFTVSADWQNSPSRARR